jgi:hypothetical protein
METHFLSIDTAILLLGKRTVKAGWRFVPDRVFGN